MISVGLFLALGMVVANTTPDESRDAIREDEANIAAGQILQYALGMHTAIQRMRVRYNLAPGEVSFVNPIVDGFENENCQTPRCQVFHPNGGGYVYDPPDQDWLDPTMFGLDGFGRWHFPRSTCIQDVPVPSSIPCEFDNDAGEEMVMMLPDLQESICRAINKNLGIGGENGEPPRNDSCPYGVNYQGVFEKGHVIRDHDGLLRGEDKGCFKQEAFDCPSMADQYVFYYTFWAR